MADKLHAGAERLGIALSDAQFGQLEQYIDSVLAFNQTYNLMKADSADELSVNHILDSLAGLPYIQELLSAKSAKDAAVRIGDIGSGGGCPGIPLAIALPGEQFTLVERMEKRCAFLESVIGRLGLSNVQVLCLQADKVAPQSFDIEVFRAFHPFDKKILKTLFTMLKKGGFLVAYKARAEKIAAEMQVVQHIVPEYKKIPLTVPFLEDHERHLVIIEKK